MQEGSNREVITNVSAEHEPTCCAYAERLIDVERCACTRRYGAMPRMVTAAVFAVVCDLSDFHSCGHIYKRNDRAAKFKVGLDCSLKE